jgi:hypothetical protein
VIWKILVEALYSVAECWDVWLILCNAYRKKWGQLT